MAMGTCAPQYVVSLSTSHLPIATSLWTDSELQVLAERGGQNVSITLHQRLASRFSGPRTHRPWWLDDAVQSGFDATGEHVFRVGKDWEEQAIFFHARTCGADLSVHIIANLPAGGVVWEAGLALASRLLCDRDGLNIDVRGKTVVELGSGTGLVRRA